MMDLPRPYRLADKAISFLFRKTASMFSRTKRSFQLSGFDELAVYRGMESLYKSLNQENEDAFRSLYESRYKEMYMYLKRSWPDEDEVDEMAEIYLANLLTEPNEVTRYAYDSEVLRKRDRATESINSAPTRAEKDYEMEKAMRYWSQQTGFYIDIIADEAALQSMKDCGVKRVRWNTQSDERVCDDCKARNGKVYDIDKVPAKEHPRCRCWLEPVGTQTDK